MRKDVQKFFDSIHGKDDSLSRAVNEARGNKDVAVQEAPVIGIKPGDHLLVQVKDVNGQGGREELLGSAETSNRKRKRASADNKKPGQRQVSFWVDDTTYKRLGYIKAYTGKLFEDMYNVAVERYVEEMERQILGASTNG